MRNVLQPKGLCLSLAVAVLVALPAAAQDPSTFSLSIGWFPTSYSTSAQLSAKDLIGSKVDLEDDLGLETNVSNLRIDGLWRFRERHRIEFGYTSWRRASEKSIQIPIQWGDKYFDAGASLKGVNNAQFIKLAYRYSIVRNDTTEIDVSAGLDTFWNSTTLEGEGTITDSTGKEISGFFKERYSYVAPAPVFGVGATRTAGENVVLRGTAEYFQVTIDETTGKILDLRASADYQFSPRWGAGLGYNWVGYRVERPRFEANFDFGGPLLYVTYRR